MVCMVLGNNINPDNEIQNRPATRFWVKIPPVENHCSVPSFKAFFTKFSISLVSSEGPSSEPSVVESKDRKANAHLILKLMCDSVVLRPHLRELLSAKYVALPQL